MQAKNSQQLRSLMMTAAVATSLGAGFGLAVRINSPTDPGSTFLHAEQSFPPRSNWPVTDTQPPLVKSQNLFFQSKPKPVNPRKLVVNSQKSVAPRQEEPVRRRRRVAFDESAAQSQERPVRRRRRVAFDESAVQSQERPVRRRRRVAFDESAVQSQERPVRRRRRVAFDESQESNVRRRSSRVRLRRSPEISQDSSVSNRQPRVRSRRYKQRRQSD
ncbi:MAG: hypothetical protein ICV86_15485 [Microcoleus sp. T3-bin5]|nr:hypothetical protein [Microcoleus sp. T3-bin5]